MKKYKIKLIVENDCQSIRKKVCLVWFLTKDLNGTSNTVDCSKAIMKNI